MPSFRGRKELLLNKFFTDMDESVIESIYKTDNFKKVKEGDVIYRPGDNSNEMYLLLRGNIKIKFPSHNYISNKIFNDFFGEKELYDTTRRNSFAVANNKCLLYIIQKHVFETLISKSKTIKKNVEIFGELKLPEVNIAEKSRLDLTKSLKPRLFKAIYSKDEEKTEDNNQDMIKYVSEINDVNIQIDDSSVDLDNIIINEEEDLEDVSVKPEDKDEKPEEVHSLMGTDRETQKGDDKIDVQHILDIISSINQHFNVYETTQSVIKELQKFSYSDAGEIYIIDVLTSELNKFVVQSGNISTIQFSSSTGLTGTCALQRKTINLGEPTKDNRFDANIDQPGDKALSKIIYLPLLGGNEDIVGVLQLARRKQAYSDKEIENLELITKHAALAIERCNSIKNMIKTENQESIDNIERFLTAKILIPISIANYYTSQLSKGAFSQKIKEMFTLIESQTNFIWDIVQSVFYYNKPNFSINTDIVNINDYMNSISKILSDYCVSRNINLFKRTGEEARINIDKGKLFMAIFQLIENACNVSADGGKVFISSNIHDAYVQISVMDEGPGIPDESSESIFITKFAKRKKRNTFGLPIAKRIVELHSGQINFSKNAKTGTTFTINIPVSEMKDKETSEIVSNSAADDLEKI